MKTTKVVTTCVSKKEQRNWDKDNPKSYEIELEVDYDNNSIYYQMSGGTGINLHTINKQAADIFEIGEHYDILISKSEVNE